MACLSTSECFGIIKQENVAFRVNRAPAAGPYRFLPRLTGAGGLEPSSVTTATSTGESSGADLEILKVAHLLQGLFGGRKVAIAVFAEHDGFKTYVIGHLAQCFAKFAFVQGLAQLFSWFLGSVM